MKTILIIIGIILIFFLVFVNVRLELRKTDAIFDVTKYNQARGIEIMGREQLLIN